MLSKEDIIVMQKFLHCMSKSTLGMQNIHEIEIDYVNENDVESKIYN